MIDLHSSPTTNDVQPGTDSMTIAQTKEAGAVSAAVEALRKAIIAADRSALEKLSADELTYGHSSGRLENKAEFIEAIASGKSGFSAIELRDQTVNVFDNIALVRHVFEGTRRNTSNDTSKMKLAILTVWRQQQEQWKLLARQAAKL
jgi:ketosteroid isomerase-like protein